MPSLVWRNTGGCKGNAGEWKGNVGECRNEGYLHPYTTTSAPRLLSDIQTTVNIGSKVPALQQMALDIHRLCLISGICIDMQWIPRDLNVLADDISKIVDRDDFTINDSVFFALDELWGPHTCDRSVRFLRRQRLCSRLVQEQQLALPPCLPNV